MTMKMAKSSKSVLLFSYKVDHFSTSSIQIPLATVGSGFDLWNDLVDRISLNDDDQAYWSEDAEVDQRYLEAVKCRQDVSP